MDKRYDKKYDDVIMYMFQKWPKYGSVMQDQTKIYRKK